MSKPIKVLGLNWADDAGARFNGTELIDEFARAGVSYKLAVGIFHTNSREEIVDAFNFRGATKLRKFTSYLEIYTGFQSRLQFWSLQIRKLKEYKEADLIHVHIVHNGWFRLESLIKMAKGKPILWTIHDPWIATGHCVFPINCQKYLKGCGDCPDLSLPLPVYRDRTAAEVERKKSIINSLNIQYHFSTKWFYDEISEALGLNPRRVSVIPFGIDTNFYKPDVNLKKNFRDKYKIPKDQLVFVIRTNGNPQKGTAIALEALRYVSKSVTVITVDERNHLDELRGVHTILEFGWVSDPNILKSIYAAADVLIMPSISETFGVMALEAMSCGIPVIYSSNCSIHEVVGAGSSFTYGNSNSDLELREKINSVIEKPDLISEEATRVRERALSEYTSTRYVESLKDLYVKTIRTWNE
jgi:glycosyltransferase involved in cell wall biosynthesis